MTQTSWLAFSIDRTSKTPVFEQICAAIRKRAISGELSEGTKLPPTRVFAADVGVSRSTIVTAYEQLVSEGYLDSLQGSGYTVCAMCEVELPNKTKRAQLTLEEGPEKKVLPFEASQPDMRLFPHRQWAKAVSRVCRTNPQAMLVGGSSFGNFELRRAIAAHVSEWRGIEALPHQIMVTAGSTDALEICLRTLLKKGDTIGLENPGYLPMRHFADAHGLFTNFLAIDESGAKLPTDAGLTRLVVLTPSHQYPLGGAMSPSRRLEYLQWATKEDAWVVEDDYDSEFRYSGRPIPAMSGFDNLNRTIYIGSFSKIFSNSLRLGYAIVPEPLIARFRTTMRRFGLKASFMPQQALAEFMASGEFYRHLRRVRRNYGERRKFLLERLALEFSQFGYVRDHQAGMQIVFHLTEGCKDTEIARRASEQGITVVPLSIFSKGNSVYNGLIMGFCAYSEEEMELALELLKTCFCEARSGHSG
ncbi:PLP-dependent aminotransferase family protein [Phaeobacter gallaeciensis]|uniref:PLP-dependent aminotransferase family protein n=2 Tax=Roseobacteraceae TaxID=2854170 RepID=A0A366XGW6_9RHOB|nr:MULTISPECIES: PLP-dependent aminotransferase family protein [Roseobacteraceae]MBT3142852.1 PLP-dependent aminotransferase family protein [Falsiruegeria litorea]MBT8167222.1 PLP-dependent aminotransferase family protein [Falsiruegeria litorea]RBW62870.1 PLP-dependent aminotransferase family protein [Phaeobacter gallaeciensis]